MKRSVLALFCAITVTIAPLASSAPSDNDVVAECAKEDPNWAPNIQSDFNNLVKSKKCSKGLGKFMYCCAKKLTFLSQDGKNLDDGKLEQWIESKMQGQGKEVLMQIVTDCHSKEYKPDLPPEKAMCGLAICCLEHIQKAQG